MANAVPNSFKQMLWKGQIDALNDTFQIILMKPGFVFDPDNHNAYADISADEVANGLGYTTGGITLANVALNINSTTDQAELTWDDVQWDATGGALVASGAIIFDDSTLVGGGDDETDAIVSWKDAGRDMIALDGTPMMVKDIMEVIR